VKHLGAGIVYFVKSYLLEDPGFDSKLEKGFLYDLGNILNISDIHPVSSMMVTGQFVPQSKGGRGVKLASHLHLLL
jgi:hypothetical protein